jgi:F1F0 ATPase subunit 2
MIDAAIGLVFGLLQGAAHLALLYASTQRFIAGGSWPETIVLSLARVAMTGGVLWIAAQIGAITLLGALGGFLLARSVILSKWVSRDG